MIKGLNYPRGVVGRLYGHAGLLVAGSIGASLLGLVSNILAARRLGPASFGFLAILSTYAFSIVYGLVSFQSWQALIHYGAKALVQARPADLKGLIKFGFLLDIGSALAGGTICAASLYVFGRLRNWETPTMEIALLYSLGIFLRLTSTPTAVLRLFDRFDLLAVRQVAAAALRTICVLAVYVSQAGLSAFLVVWLATEIADCWMTTLLGYRELRRRGLRRVLHASVRGITSKFPQLWKFFIFSNLQVSLRLAVKEVDILVIGGLLGAAAAGVYKIVRQFARAIGRLEEAMRQAIYPDLSKTWAGRDSTDFRELLWKPALGMAGLGVLAWLGFMLLGRPLLRLTVGPHFEASYGPILVYLVGVIISMATFHFPSILLAMGRPGDILQAALAGAIGYLPILAWLSRERGIIGAASAFVIYQTLWSAWLGVKIRKGLTLAHSTGLAAIIPEDAGETESLIE
jgi:O-antigen/teichoic acid export membrane protein